MGSAYTESDGLAVLGFFIDVVENSTLVDNFFDTKLNTILSTAESKLDNEVFGTSDSADFSMSERKRRSTIEDDIIDDVIVTFTGSIASEAYRLKNYYRCVCESSR